MLNINSLNFIKFPGGELHLADDKYYTKDGSNEIEHHWLQEEPVDKIVCRITSSDDVMKLALFTDAYKRVFKQPKELVIPYMPYARQDRVANVGEALSVKVISNIINSLNYEKVTILDPHSDVTKALINNINPIEQSLIWGKYIKAFTHQEYREGEVDLSQIDLISPDAGALKKIYSINAFTQPNSYDSTPTAIKNIRVGIKHRDTTTGKITGSSIDGQPFAKVAVIVDDICDGGRTFIELAKLIRKEYDYIILCVTHGIFSKGLEVLHEYIDRVVTTDSWNDKLSGQKGLEVFSIDTILSLQQ